MLTIYINGIEQSLAQKQFTYNNNSTNSGIKIGTETTFTGNNVIIDSADAGEVINWKNCIGIKGTLEASTQLYGYIDDFRIYKKFFNIQDMEYMVRNILFITPNSITAYGNPGIYFTPNIDRMGFGTNDPQAKLHVIGDSIIEGDTTIAGDLYVCNLDLNKNATLYTNHLMATADVTTHALNTYELNATTANIDALSINHAMIDRLNTNTSSNTELYVNDKAVIKNLYNNKIFLQSSISNNNISLFTEGTHDLRIINLENTTGKLKTNNISINNIHLDDYTLGGISFTDNVQLPSVKLAVGDTIANMNPSLNFFVNGSGLITNCQINTLNVGTIISAASIININSETIFAENITVDNGTGKIDVTVNGAISANTVNSDVIKCGSDLNSTNITTIQDANITTGKITIDANRAGNFTAGTLVKDVNFRNRFFVGYNTAGYFGMFSTPADNYADAADSFNISAGAGTIECKILRCSNFEGSIKGQNLSATGIRILGPSAITRNDTTVLSSQFVIDADVDSQAKGNFTVGSDIATAISELSKPVFTIQNNMQAYMYNSITTFKSTKYTNRATERIIIDEGTIRLTSGDVKVTSGDIIAQSGNLQLGNGNIDLSFGDINLKNGILSIDSGDLSINSGDITVGGIIKSIKIENSDKISSSSISVANGTVTIDATGIVTNSIKTTAGTTNINFENVTVGQDASILTYYQNFKRYIPYEIITDSIASTESYYTNTKGSSVALDGSGWRISKSNIDLFTLFDIYGGTYSIASRYQTIVVNLSDNTLSIKMETTYNFYATEFDI
eukprot:534574-Hanusia_phi.AAC.2